MENVQTVNIAKIKANTEKIATLAGHTDCVYALCQAGNSDYFFSAAGDGMVARWDLANPEIGDLIAKVPNSIYAIQYFNTTNQLLIGQNFEGIHLIDWENKKEIRSAKITDDAIFDIQIYENLAFIGCGDGVLIIFDLLHWAVVKHIKISDKSLRSIDIATQKQEIALGYSDFHIRILDLQTFKPKHNFQAHKNSVFALAYTKDEKYLLSGGRDAHLNIWQATKQYALSQSIAAHLYAINAIALSPKGRVFATASMDKSIKLWDTQSFKLIKVIDKARHAGHGTSVNKLLWHEERGHLVAGSDDRSLSVWDLKFYAVS